MIFTQQEIPFIGKGRAVSKSTLMEFLQGGVNVCEYMLTKRCDDVLGLRVSTRLGVDEATRLEEATGWLNRALRLACASSRDTDVMLDSICTCEKTLAHLKAIGVETVSDVRRMDVTVFRAIMMRAEKADAERQYHLLALKA